MHTILYTAEEIPEAPLCLYCEPVKLTRNSLTGLTQSFWYEPCEDHQPKENND